MINDRWGLQTMLINYTYKLSLELYMQGGEMVKNGEKWVTQGGADRM